MTQKLLSILLMLTCFCGSLMADHLSSSLLFTARMSGDNEVPAVTSNGQGVGIFTFDEKKSTLYVNVSLSSLSGPITAIHIHEGAVGVNGGVVYNLTPFLQGKRVKAVIPNITRESFAKLVDGAYYINAHTDLHPGGEIRGQIGLETDSRYAARLDGDQEVPAVSTSGQGIFVANLSQSGTVVDFRMIFEGLTSPVVGAHIHNAPAGANGGVIFDLTPFLLGNSIVGSWDPTGFLDALRAGELYVNVHTVNNPGGEIRGQLLLDQGLMFDAYMDGDQESPAVDGPARGIALINVSSDLTTLEYHILIDSASGTINDAHFHAAGVGVNGGVVIDISDDINGNVISGSQPITIDLLNQMLSGGLYLNAHTDAHPAGELRGQVYKLAREGYTFDINGGQEVPPTNSTGRGAGMVSIDRDQSNAHFMIVYHDLTGNFTASHFHNGVPGENGGVIFNLTPFYNAFGGAYGYWESGFDAASSLLFRENSVYTNIHSDMFPAGEIRGNVIRARDLFHTDPPFDPGFGNDFILVAELTGASEVPEVTTDGVGLASFYFNEDRTTAEVNVTVTGLSGQITGAHVHEGFQGVNGPVVFPLIAEGKRIHGTITGITPEQLGKFIQGAYYINIHTADHPGGEIRGQIFLEQDATFLAGLTGNEEVPTVATDGRGLGIFHYTVGTLSLDVDMQVTELSSDITGAHLHQGAPGENGGVIIDLGPLRDGNRFEGTVPLTINDFLALVTGNVYVNVHTTDHPGGEIRGQLNYQDGITFDGWMSGLQEVPFANTTASGLMAAVTSNDLQTVNVFMVSDGLSGGASAAHFHNAALGTNGGVVLDLSSGLNDDDIVFSGPLSSDVFNAMMTGDVYANVHTAAYPGGEMRGQLFSLIRDPYGYDICPEQEVGVVNAPSATGSGVVTIDRLHTNADILAVLDGLTGVINAAHFHRASIGTNGGVIYTLTNALVGTTLSGYGIPMDTGVINTIREGNAYFNAHTALHPAGEVRGQVVKELLCGIEVGVNEIEDIVNEVILSPVPVDDQLNIGLDARTNMELTLRVFDMSGKLMSSDQFAVSEGKNILHVNTMRLHPGFYVLMISDGGAAQAYKFVK